MMVLWTIRNIDLVISEIDFKNGSIKDVLKIFKKNNIQIPFKSIDDVKMAYNFDNLDKILCF